MLRSASVVVVKDLISSLSSLSFPKVQKSNPCGFHSPASNEPTIRPKKYQFIHIEVAHSSAAAAAEVVGAVWIAGVNVPRNRNQFSVCAQTKVI